ncbi:hypothetical protein ACVWW6_008816 [Bradyrhizobium sp. USDA 3311]|nr:MULTISPECIES: hypothetical protein [Bradyrhizobium]
MAGIYARSSDLRVRSPMPLCAAWTCRLTLLLVIGSPQKQCAWPLVG